MRSLGPIVLLYSIFSISLTNWTCANSHNYESSGSSAQNRHLCPVIKPKTGEVIDCKNPQKPTFKVNCTIEESVEYTIAELRCEEFWSSENTRLLPVKQVCLNGHWVKEDTNFSCKFTCGVHQGHPTNRQKIQNVYPWVVGIFILKKPSLSHHHHQSAQYQFICQGTLISPCVIVTAAQCVTYRDTTVERRAEDFKVVLHSVHRTFKTSFNYVHVEKVVLHHAYNATTLENDVAILWLKQIVKLDSQIHPVCLPDEEDELDIGSEGKVRIVKDGSLVEEKLKVVSTAVCSQELSDTSQFVKLVNSKFCTQLAIFNPNQSETSDLYCNGDFGNGFVTLSDNGIIKKLILHGIRTGRIPFPADGVECTQTQTLLFTKVPILRQWIDRELAREPPIYLEDSETAIYPSLPSSTHGTTTPATTHVREREPLTPEPFLVSHFHTQRPMEVETFYSQHPLTAIVDRNRDIESKNNTEFIPHMTTTVTPASNSGHRNHTPFYGVLPTRFPITSNPMPIHPKNNHEISTKAPTSTTQVIDLVESDRKDAAPSLNRTYVCPPITSQTGVAQVCKHDDYEDIDDCSNGGQVGTVAILKCNNFYKPSFGAGFLKKECISNNRWTPSRAFGCQLECGISSKPRKSFIVNGIVSDRISWPWHATIFIKIGNDTRYICGGTLISKSVILTAAHCVTVPRTATLRDNDELRVILAANSSNYTANLLDTISNTNLFYVKSILIPESYNGVTFEADIALIQLEFCVELSDYVKPVCFPFQSKENSNIEQLQLSPGSIGQTVGFGIDESGKPSKTIRETSIPVISHRECGEALSRFPSSSQFCAGYLNGTAVCNGDSGSGLVFSEGTGYTNRYIIQGIISYGDHTSGSKICNHETYAVFTKASSFAFWVQLQLEVLEPDYSK